MPNHVLTEVVIRGVDLSEQKQILEYVGSASSAVDFQTLLPMPLNVWQGDVGAEEEQAFGKANTGFDWSRLNWGTKWNAYGIRTGEVGDYATIVQASDTLTITFQTAWSTPHGWLLALWHKIERPLEYTWLDEGQLSAKVGQFTTYECGLRERSWSEADADEATTRRMHKMLWGVEEFDDEDE